MEDNGFCVLWIGGGWMFAGEETGQWAVGQRTAILFFTLDYGPGFFLCFSWEKIIHHLNGKLLVRSYSAVCERRWVFVWR
jgi:hypothetical protein